ncbi:MAG: hypothetical protein IV100_22265 [Myxococcales bacterium]|nr:hypothetical protein [Myxococcales bacterium]
MNHVTKSSALSILLAALLGTACSEESTTATGSDTMTPQSCSATSECTSGQICAGSVCGACQVDAQCQADYGVTSICEAGACTTVGCPEGSNGCACYPNDTCDSGLCREGLCQACSEGADGCPCYPNDTCDAGECVSGTCYACPPGRVDCPCDGGTCTEGRCVEGTCAACSDGLVGCECSTGACTEGLCISGRCEPCVDGVVGCDCTAAGTCTDGRCDDGQCVACDDGVVGCPCAAEDACPGARCVTGECVACADGLLGCPCGAAGACDDGVCEGGTCVACTPGVLTCPCATVAAEGDVPCPGGRCVNDVCEACTAGSLGCGCADGACDSGWCIGDVCTECTQGASGCVCLDNDTCAAGLQCVSGSCEPCPAGGTGCPCDAGSCSQGLACAAGICVADDCVAGDAGCPCDGGVCDEGLACDGGICVACADHLAGCECADGNCQGDLVCDQGVCRAPLKCADVCAPHQLCEDPSVGTDPSCKLECDSGWAWDDAVGQCTLTVTATCSEGEPGSIAADCAGENRQCVTDGDGASCGDCLAGYRDEAGLLEVCRVVFDCDIQNCAAQNRVCEPETETTDAECLSCLPYHVEESSFCRPAETCDDVDCSALNRTCVAETATGDATCGGCLNYHQLAGDVCVAVKTCDDLGCLLAHRTCTAETASNDASCGECMPYFRVQGSVCVGVFTCDDLGCAAKSRACTDQTATTDATCGDCLSGFVESAGSCRALLTCDTAGCVAENRECTPAGATTDATCGVCQAWFKDDGSGTGTCDAVATCDGLGCGAKNRECEDETATTDAYCDACLPGFIEDGDVCVIPPPTCEPGEPGSVLDACESLNRMCDESAAGGAACGDCQDGYAEDDNGECQLITSCDSLGCAGKYRLCSGDWPFQSCGDCFDGTVESPNDATRCEPPKTCAETVCDLGEFCLEGDGITTGARCVVNDCPDGEAYSSYAGKCVACIVACGDDEGETGEVWPITLANSQACICETEDGYYWDEGGTRSARPCDADGDGWVRDAARDYLVDQDDASLWQNARCDLRTIDRFVLENELGQRLSVYVCDGEPPFLREGADGECEFGLLDVDLFESTRNDDQDEVAADSLVPDYSLSGNGRAFVASELNPMTRACLKASDLNDNGLTDAREWHGMDAGNFSGEYASEQYIFSRFSYFMELHTGFYESGTESLVGQYVISERSRCDDDFPIHYGSTSSTDWRGCTRSRDALWDATDGEDGPDFGYDFAEWSCDETTGTCPIPPPASTALPNGSAPVHGLCDVYRPIVDDECDDVDSPWLCVDGAVWRGMTHHSQFRCVEVDDTASTVTPVIPTASFYPVYEGQYLFSQCHVACQAGDTSCESDCTSGLCDTSSVETDGLPSDPVLECEVDETPEAGQVGFAVALYQDSAGGYERGCINEWTPTAVEGTENGTEDVEVAPWRELCPGFSTLPDSVVGQGDQNNFGVLQCGCGNNFGGPDCDVGCPNELLHVSDPYETTPRSGWWLCGDFAASGFETVDDSEGPAGVGLDTDGAKWVIRGEVESGADDTLLCENPNCDAIGVTDSQRVSYGSAFICGFSLDCTATAKTWAEADALCQSQGGRLCTEAELDDNEAQATGCSFDYTTVWSATACDGGYVAQAGATHQLGNYPKQCLAATATAAVRCCAEATCDTGYGLR